MYFTTVINRGGKVTGMLRVPCLYEYRYIHTSKSAFLYIDRQYFCQEVLQVSFINLNRYHIQYVHSVIYTCIVPYFLNFTLKRDEMNTRNPSYFMLKE